MTAWDRFNALPPPSGPNFYRVEQTSRRWRVGRTAEGFPAILIAFPAGSVSSPRRLATLTYSPPTSIELLGDDGALETATLAVLECRTVDRDLCQYFLRVVETLFAVPDLFAREDELERTLDALVTLFRGLGKPGFKTVEGLWAELAIILWARDPAFAVSAWHSEPTALHDFGAGASRLEVKSTVRRLREHAFSVDQVTSLRAAATLVASVMLRSADDGASVFEMVEAIKQRLTMTPGLAARLESIVAASLGESWRDAADERFALPAARESLRFFDADSIPTIPQPLPPEIKDIRFVVDLSGVQPLEHATARALGPFFEALVPEGPGTSGER